MSNDMTTAQQKVYDALVELDNLYGYPPTQTEIAEMIGISQASVAKTLTRLERDGYIARAYGIGRTLRVV
jgi:repressor LexA